jgi:hypothetical protein
MTAPKGLSSLLSSLLDSGITIDDGNERIIISLDRTPGRKSGRRLMFALRTAPSVRPWQARGRPAAYTNALTPTGKVSSRKLYSIIQAFEGGISKASLVKESGVGRKKLKAAVQRLRSRGLVTERGGRYFPVPVSGPHAPAARRRPHGGCNVPGCYAAHYAKGLCNNHYNSQRRQSVRQPGPGETGRRTNGTYKQAILSRLRGMPRRQTLFQLAANLNEKWQSLRKAVQELVAENRLVKQGKHYLLSSVERRAPGTER